jgi:hypothetical protein
MRLRTLLTVLTVLLVGVITTTAKPTPAQAGICWVCSLHPWQEECQFTSDTEMSYETCEMMPEGCVTQSPCGGGVASLGADGTVASVADGNGGDIIQRSSKSGQTVRGCGGAILERSYSQQSVDQIHEYSKALTL